MDDLDYGARGKIGLIYPALGWVMEPEFYAMLPKGVSVQTTRVANGDTDVEGLNRLIRGIKDASYLLSGIPVDVMMLGCTSASFVNGAAFEKSFVEEMERLHKIPFTTTSTSVVEAVKAFGVQKVAIATPYVDEVNERAVAYLKEFGIETVNIIGKGLLYDKDIDAIPLEEVFRMGVEANVAEAEAVLLLCTGLRTVPIIDILEKTIQKPVISAIQASLWHALRKMGVHDKVFEYGSLLEKY